jgi:hypothetical protein
MVLLTDTPTFASKATKEQGAATTRILEARGCRPDPKIVSHTINC